MFDSFDTFFGEGDEYDKADRPVSREDVLRYFAFREHLEQENAAQEEILQNMTVQLSVKFLLLSDARQPADIIEKLRRQLIPNDRGEFMRMLKELLQNGDVPVWRKIGLLRVGIRRIIHCADIDRTLLSSGIKNDDLLEKLGDAMRRKAEEH